MFCMVVHTMVLLHRDICMSSEAAAGQIPNDIHFCADLPCDLLCRTLVLQPFQRPPQQGMDSLCQMVNQLHLPRMSPRGTAMVLWKTGGALLVPCLLRVLLQGNLLLCLLFGLCMQTPCACAHQDRCALSACASSGAMTATLALSTQSLFVMKHFASSSGILLSAL